MDKVGNGAARRRCTGMGQHGKLKYGDITVKYRPGPVLQAAFRRLAAMAVPGRENGQNSKPLSVLWLNNH
ncbi:MULTISPECIES: hypothetical protein [unclassified Janthinobacterium]|uniref:hypothetical protein n=1 Tax=unclassified Janthinobacterium TaxID=2610881 RepID=UPI001E4397EB|nr:MULTISPECIES: hypothetical protein [unclassified Janthinobacterium]MCC7641610.1 hypothetical protein [Janthinobacterium sp. EB271-G4-3-1]MCC7690863.1 hypothetical protein [Janthinobacterium sp. EB271-G4-3-2]